jgi:membrane protease YdiL (CAAX protease family)
MIPNRNTRWVLAMLYFIVSMVELTFAYAPPTVTHKYSAVTMMPSINSYQTSSTRFNSRLSMSISKPRFSIATKFSSLAKHRNLSSWMTRKQQLATGDVRQNVLLQLSKNQNSNQNVSTNSFDQKLDQIINRLQTLPPLVQLTVLISTYIMHLLVLTQHSIIFPFQLIPNDKGWFQSIGLDSVAGILSFMSIGLLRKRQLNKKGENVTIPSLFSGVYDYQIVEKISKSKSKQKKNKYDDNTNSKSIESKDHIHMKVKQRPTSPISPWKFPLTVQNNSPSARVTSMVALTLLVSAYFLTGRLASMVELYLYALAGLGVPLTIAMHRSLVVLGGHLAWVAIGSGILGVILRPQPFFGGGNKLFAVEKDRNDSNIEDEADNSDEATEIILKKQKYKWFTNKWNSNWVWWTISGYFISSWFFNIADFLNQIILPAHVFELAGEGVVSQLINPENNDIAASLVGYIAPCITAPWWEEVLYRGFLLPALTLQMKFWPAVFVSGVVFSIHHVSTTGAIPLAILGWTWAAIYAKSGNLMVTILIHAMWNSRVFLGSWLGL